MCCTFPSICYIPEIKFQLAKPAKSIFTLARDNVFLSTTVFLSITFFMTILLPTTATCLYAPPAPVLKIHDSHNFRSVSNTKRRTLFVRDVPGSTFLPDSGFYRITDPDSDSKMIFVIVHIYQHIICLCSGLNFHRISDSRLYRIPKILSHPYFLYSQ